MASLIFKVHFGYVELHERKGKICGLKILREIEEEEKGPLIGEGRGSPLLNRAKLEILEYLSMKRRGFTLPLCLSGLSPFTKRVLQRVKTIGYGEKRSYGELARELGIPGGQRSVGQALRKNPIPILIPCHRVVNSNGSLGGYGSGREIKAFLLELEEGASGILSEPLNG